MGEWASGRNGEVDGVDERAHHPKKFPGFRGGNLIQIEARLARLIAEPLRRTPYEKIIVVHFSGKYVCDFVVDAGNGCAAVYAGRFECSSKCSRESRGCRG